MGTWQDTVWQYSSAPDSVCSVTCPVVTSPGLQQSTHTVTLTHTVTHMLTLLITKLSSPICSFFLQLTFSPHLGTAKVSWNKWAEQRMGRDTEWARGQPWFCIPLLSVSQRAEDLSFHLIPSIQSLLLHLPLGSLIQLSLISFKIPQEQHVWCFLSNSWLLAHHTPSSLCVSVCVWFIINDSDWYSSPLPQRQAGVSRTRGAASSPRHLSLKAIHIRTGLSVDWLLNRAGTVSEGMRKRRCTYLSVKVKDSF